MKSKEPANGDPRSRKFRHWVLFKGSNNPSPAFEKNAGAACYRPLHWMWPRSMYMQEPHAAERLKL
jgi:hypothetical protein